MANAAVCKTAIRGFDSRPGLQTYNLGVAFFIYAEVAKLADAPALGAGGSNPVGVRLSPSAQTLEFHLFARYDRVHICGHRIVAIMRPCQGRDGSSTLPDRTSVLPRWRNGLRRGLKILGSKGLVGSNPTRGTLKNIF